jgi:glycosyltransferase involved in cell wall biosynthesis
MIHDVIPHEGDHGVNRVDFMNWVVCKLSNEIIICNKKYKQNLCERYSVDDNRVKTINLWERFPSFSSSIRTRRILFFGRLNPYKGVDNLLEIVKICSDLQFIIVGKTDPQISEIIKELSKHDNIKINSKYIPDEIIPEIFSNADWVILPYNTATQSGVILEAYKNSKPVIAFNVGAISEQIEDGLSGYLVPAKDVSEFVTVLRKAMAINDDEYLKFCENAYSYGFRKFSASIVSIEFEDLLLGNE